MKKLLLLIALLISTPAFSAEYLTAVTMHGKNIGQYIVTEENGEYVIEQSLFERLKLPIVEAKPLTFLNKYGTYDFNRVSQSLLFLPDKPEWFKEQKKRANGPNDGELVKSKDFDLKSVDYQANATYGSSAPVYSLFGTATGRLYIADIDASFSTLDGKSTGTAQWHDEKNKYIRDAQIGAVPLYGIKYGVSASNEPITRYQNGFGTQPVFVNYPIGTRIELYRNGNYLNTFVCDAPNFRIDLELAYGTSEFLIRAFQPDGNVKEQKIKKSVDSFMVAPGQFEYSAAYGTAENKSQQYKLRASYGLKSWVTIFTDNDVKGRSIGSYFKINDDLLVTPKLYNDGYAGELYYNWQWLNFAGSFNNRTDHKDRRGIIGISSFLNPVLSIVQDDLTKTTSYTARITQSYQRLHVSPYFEHKSVNGEISKAAGFNAMLLMQHGYRVQGDYRYQDNGSQTFSYNVIKSLNIGELKAFVDFYSTPTTDFTIKDAGAEVRLYNFKYASLSAVYTHNFAEKNDTATFSISGSLTRGGTVKSAQRTYATVKVSTFIDNNNNGVQDDGDEPISSTITINNQLYETTKGSVLIYDLVPYIRYEINTQGEVDAEPKEPTYITIPNRGELVEVNIPFIAMKEVEGQVQGKKEVLIVKLTDDLGKVRTTKTSYEGYYMFRVPANRTYTIDEGKPAVTPVVVPEAPKATPAPVEAQKPVVKKSDEPQEQPKSASQTEYEETEPETEETGEIDKQIEIEVVKEDISYVSRIKVYRLPSVASLKRIVEEINKTNPVKILIHGYAKDRKTAWKLAKRTERQIEKYGVYIRGIEGYAKK